MGDFKFVSERFFIKVMISDEVVSFYKVMIIHEVINIY